MDSGESEDSVDLPHINVTSSAATPEAVRSLISLCHHVNVFVYT